jgi:hypothetical protein
MIRSRAPAKLRSFACTYQYAAADIDISDGLATAATPHY